MSLHGIFCVLEGEKTGVKVLLAKLETACTVYSLVIY